MDIWDWLIPLPRLLYRREANTQKNHELCTDINYYFLDRYNVYTQKNYRASNNIDYYLGLDETRRRYYNIITTTTLIEGGDNILYYCKLNHIGLPNLGQGIIALWVKLSRPIFYPFITRQSIVIILHLCL
jgi:hypothetical protein